MPMSEEKKITKKCGWVVVSGDASLSDRKVLSWHETFKDARESKRPLFSSVRKETPKECSVRLKARKEALAQGE